MRPLAACLFVTALLLAPARPQAAPTEARCPDELRIAVLDYELAPLLLGKDKFAAPTGKLIDWLRLAVQRSGCNPRLQFQRLPIKRGRELLYRGDIDVWGVAFPGAELMTQSALPMLDKQVDPQLGFYLSTYSLYVPLQDNQISWDGQQLRGHEDMRIGVAPVPALQNLLSERNWPAEMGIDTQNVLDKLLSGRSAVAILPDMLVAAQPADVPARLRKLSPPVLTSWYYAPVSRFLIARHPAFVRSFWLELCRAGRSEQRHPQPCRDPGAADKP